MALHLLDDLAQPFAPCRSASSIAFNVSGSSGRLSIDTHRSDHIRRRFAMIARPLIHFAAAALHYPA